MAGRVRRVRPEEELTLVEHLDELRTRLVITLVALVVAVAIFMWKSDQLLHFLRSPIGYRQLLVISPGEAFITSLTVAVYAGVLVTLPILIYQLYAFVIPAFSEEHHRTLRPLVVLVPALFVVGVVFGWYLVLPPALRFLLNYNAASFHVQLRAREYMQFVMLTLLAMGLVFELPAFMLVLGRLGIVTSEMMRRHWRPAVVILTAVAVALPGTDPITMLVEEIPLLVLYLISYFLVRIVERRRQADDGMFPWPTE